MPEVSAKAFLGKILLWLPLSFTAWYLMASLLLWPVTLLISVVFSLFYPGVIENVEQHGTLLDVNTRFSADQAPGAQPSSGQEGGLLYFTLNPLKFGYCLPLLLALQLATPGRFVRKLGLFAIGAVILVPVQAWGIYFETLITLVFKTGPMIAQSMGTTALSREGIALSYQLGVLILPSVTPLLIWATLNQDFIVKLAGRPAENRVLTDHSS